MITLVTVQNSLGVSRVECLAADLVVEQIRAVLADIPPGAAKTGALGNREIIQAVADLAVDFRFPLVVDPVMVSKHGASLLAADSVEVLRTRLLPMAFLITPNLEEAGMLAGMEVNDVATMRAAAEKIAAMGPQAVLVKGGHLSGDAIDVLFYRDEWFEFTAPRIETRHTHGTGCTYAAAITASIAASDKLPDAIQKAKRYVTEAIRTNPGLGGGSGPLNHHATRT